MKRLTVAFLMGLMFVAGCSPQPYTMMGDPPEQLQNCMDYITFYNVLPEDKDAIEKYVHRVCAIKGHANALRKAKSIIVMPEPFDKVATECSALAGTPAMACTSRRTVAKHDYSVRIAHGNPGALFHELIHVVLWEQGVDGPGEHHKIMFEKGWFFVDHHNDTE